MTNNSQVIAEQVFEIRHSAFGGFLDMRGRIADFIKEGSKAFEHWNIDTNVVSFRDQANMIKTDGAFVGYKSAGYIVLDPPTRNYLEDRATAFWRLLLKMPGYELEDLNRFGVRTKLFYPVKSSFDELNSKLYKFGFSDGFRALIGGTQTDLSFTLELRDSGFEMNLKVSPFHSDEADNYFLFDSGHFKKCGLFLDIDCSRKEGLDLDSIPVLLKNSLKLIWSKSEQIARGLDV